MKTAGGESSVDDNVYIDDDEDDERSLPPGTGHGSRIIPG
jgi:hypothetical protein